MSDLPDRSEAHLIRHVYQSDHVMSQRAMAIAVTIIGAWADGDLKSRDEWLAEVRATEMTIRFGDTEEGLDVDWVGTDGPPGLWVLVPGMDDPHGIAEDWNSPEDNAAWGVDDD